MVNGVDDPPCRTSTSMRALQRRRSSAPSVSSHALQGEAISHRRSTTSPTVIFTSRLHLVATCTIVTPTMNTPTPRWASTMPNQLRDERASCASRERQPPPGSPRSRSTSTAVVLVKTQAARNRPSAAHVDAVVVPPPSGRASAAATLAETPAALQRQPVAQLSHRGRLPTGQRADAHQQHDRRHQRHEDGLEVGRADRDLAQVQRVERQRVQRAQHDRAGGHRQQHVVAQQQGLTRDAGRSRPPKPTLVGAPAEQGQ